ncbi:hypothetical protein Mycch_1271 [Mycolicibacterium chubuense NBB4]|uniref:Lipoprotein LpqN n=1 Tax=Mycolicibacterium chubuense (strain NBB4) TaxID=710421 RepID=I4BFM2_MYCCN|nr:hypothetical protein [Mycolicibacterium chubuense]AFM16079.1 hypothetical protein Mycch_1271 [Mycolicibacterium chubuense NBB4]
MTVDRGKACLATALAVATLATACGKHQDTTASPASNACSAQHPTGDTTPIPGTRIALHVADGMQVDPGLPGIVRPNTRTSIKVVDQPQPSGSTPPDQMLGKLEDALGRSPGPGKPGLVLDAPKTAEIAGFPASVVTATETRPEGSFRDVLAAIAAPGSFVTFTGTVEQNDPLTNQQLLDTYCGARWLDQRAEANLGFHITPSGDYKPMPSSGSLLFALHGDPGPNAPIFLATPSKNQGPVPPDARRALAEARFGAIPGNPHVDTILETSVAGLPAWEIIGDSDSASLYQMVVFTDRGYILLSGAANKSVADQITTFRQMAQSLTL